MNKIKSLNGYSIYEATKKDEKKYNVEEGYFYIYFSSDIKDYGLANSDWDFEAGSIEEAEEICNGSNYAKAKAIVESKTTYASYEEIEKVEKLLDEKQAKQTKDLEQKREGNVSHSLPHAVAEVVLQKMDDMRLGQRAYADISAMVEDVMGDSSLMGQSFETVPLEEKKLLAEKSMQVLMETKERCYKEGLSPLQQEFFENSHFKHADGSLMKFYTLQEEGKSSFETGTIFTSNAKDAVSTEGGNHEKVYEVFVNTSRGFLTEGTVTFDMFFEAYLETQDEFLRPFDVNKDVKGFVDFCIGEDIKFDALVLGNEQKGYTLINLRNCEIKETSDLSPKHDGKINSKDARSVSKDKASLQKNMQEKTSDTRKDAGER